MESQFIAHIRDDNIQTIEEHCSQVAKYASEEAKFSYLRTVMFMTGILHDIGKYSDAFQKYIMDAQKNPENAKRGSVNHSNAGGSFLLLQKTDNDPWKKVTLEFMACAIFQHHGLMDCVKDGHDILRKRTEKDPEILDADFQRAQSFLNQNLIDMLPSAKQEIQSYVNKLNTIAKKMNHNSSVKEDGYFLFACLERLILSYLVDADWRDTAEFMNNMKESRVSQNDREQFFEDSLQKIEDYVSRFTADTKINQLRQEMANDCLQADIANEGIYRLSMPTGGGKTITSMRLALRLAKKYHKKHIIYIAPFLSILEQNAQVIRSIIQNDDYILEHHSNVDISEEDEVYRNLCETWDSPVILTTMVQFLNTMFLGKMSSVRRFHQLTDTIIIIDEAQAIPVKCIHMFNATMNFLCYSGNSIGILCTATQPLFELVNRNLIYQENKDILPNVEKYQKAFKRTKIISEVGNKPMDTDELVTFIQNVFDQNLLVVLNTKGAVKTLYDALKTNLDPDVKLVQLTTYMCAEHRLDVIHELKETLKNQRVICISTQLIEAGVDISFATVIRSLAGVDSLNQAAGRCNRNGEKDMSAVYVVDYVEEKTSRLPDIQEAKKATRSLIDAKIEEFSTSAAINRFYQQYYFMRKGEMDYNIHHHTLFAILSKNMARVEDVKATEGTYEHFLCQSFRTAGQEFSVIDNQQMVSLAVPYQKGKDYLDEIERTDDYEVMDYNLKKLQRYTITLFTNDQMLKKMLERQAISFIEKAGIYTVDPGYYNDQGITDELQMLVF